jgi:hypothetical protein
VKYFSDDSVWALSQKGDIYRRYGITQTNFVGDYWKKVPGNAKALTGILPSIFNICVILSYMQPEQTSQVLFVSKF